MKLLFSLFLFIQTLAFSAPHVILIGAPGAGKGTLTQALTKTHTYKHFCIGDILRAEIEKKSALGNSIEEKVTKGELIPSELLFPLVEKTLKEAFALNYSIILDGAIQSEENIVFIDNLFTSLDLNKNTYYLYLQVDRKAAYERLNSRAICQSCGYTINTKTLSSNTCPNCMKDLSVRLDDSQEVFVKRLDRFYNKVEPLLKFYENKKNFLIINANQSPNTVLDEILTLLQHEL